MNEKGWKYPVLRRLSKNLILLFYFKILPRQLLDKNSLNLFYEFDWMDAKTQILVNLGPVLLSRPRARGEAAMVEPWLE